MKSIPLLMALAFGAAVGAGPLEAQTAVQTNCPPNHIWAVPTDTMAAPWAALHPRETFSSAQARLADRRGWAVAAQEVEAAFQALADAARLDATTRGRLQQALDAMAADLRDNAGTTAGVAEQGRFEHTLRSAETVAFVDIGGGELVVDAASGLPYVRAVCWTAAAANELLGLANAPARRATLEGLSAIVRRWDAFNSSGYSQFPWELFLNRPRGLDPPARQWILLHPGVGIELPGIFDDIENAARTETVIVEVLGLLWYNRARTAYFGFSALVSLPAELGPGAGAMLHAGPLKAGYIFRAEAHGESSKDGLLITADLLQLFRGAPAMYQQARDDAGSMLARALSQEP